jgi:hypothetical protein
MGKISKIFLRTRNGNASLIAIRQHWLWYGDSILYQRISQGLLGSSVLR